MGERPWLGCTGQRCLREKMPAARLVTPKESDDAEEWRP